MEISENLKEKFNIAVENCNLAYIWYCAKKILDYHDGDISEHDSVVDNYINNAAITVCNVVNAIFDEALIIDKEILPKTIAKISLYMASNITTINSSIIDSKNEEIEKKRDYIDAKIAMQAIIIASDTFFKSVINRSNTQNDCWANALSAASTEIKSSIIKTVIAE